MDKKLKASILARIEQRLKDLNLPATAASVQAGFNEGLIRDMGRKEKAMPGVDKIAALANVLETTPEWLAFGVDSQSVAPSPLEIRGDVAAGAWLEIDIIDENALDTIPITADPRYPRAAQYALGVRGTSINRLAQTGDYLICVDLGLTGLDPKADDIVIVERRRMQGAMREVTAKRVERRGKTIVLYPDSDDPRWQEPIIINGGDTGDDEIAIIAIVTGVYRPIRGRPR